MSKLNPRAPPFIPNAKVVSNAPSASASKEEEKVTKADFYQFMFPQRASPPISLARDATSSGPTNTASSLSGKFERDFPDHFKLENFDIIFNAFEVEAKANLPDPSVVTAYNASVTNKQVVLYDVDTLITVQFFETLTAIDIFCVSFVSHSGVWLLQPTRLISLVSERLPLERWDPLST